MTDGYERNKILTAGPATFYVKWVNNRDKNNFPLMTKSKDYKIMVILNCTDSKGEAGDVYQHLTAVRPFYFNQLLASIALPNHYTPEMLIEDPMPLKGLSGRCILSVRDSEEWGKSMQVKEYLQPFMLKPTTVAQVLAEDFFDDEIPF